jgi:translation initiation factor IF-2
VPKRIYALAKELNIDSKKLVEICAKAGIRGKGSALASLEDDEIDKLKGFLVGGDKKGDAPTRRGRSDEGVPVRRDQDSVAAKAAPERSKPKVITPSRTAKSSPLGSRVTKVTGHELPDLPEKPTPEPPAEQPTPAEPTPAPEPPPPEIAAEADAETQATPPAAPPSRTAADPNSPQRFDPLAPQRPTDRGRGGRVPVLGGGDAKRGRGKPAEERAKDGDEPAGPRKGRVVRLGALPPQQDTPKPKEPKKSAEPAAQKPVMKLPKDAIRGAQQGSNKPLDRFRREEDQRRPAGATPGGETAASPRGKRGKGKGPAEKEDRLAGMSGSRAARQQNRRRRSPDESDRPMRQYRRRPPKRSGVNTAAPRKGRVSIELPCSIREFSEASGTSTAVIQRAMMGLGKMATINMQLDYEDAELLAAELELDLDIREAQSLEDTVLTAIREAEDDPDSLISRPPIITFLGHVDHGKTSLLDYLIGINVVSGEAGGITQHIRAYTIEKDDRKISFVDTPGHEAFTEMRARGANVTDIAVLVIAADDGIMPQTEEAISHAKAAEVPIIVAMNKIDLPAADPDKVYRQLSEQGLLPVEWGGDIEVVKTSAISGEGMDTLLETILLTAEINEYSANPNRPAFGTCLESQQEGDRGVVAKLIVKNGTLKVGDIVVCGSGHGRVKAMYDTLLTNERVEEAGPSTPVNVLGLDLAPEAGDAFYVLDDIAAAREIAANRDVQRRHESLGVYTAKVSFDEFQRRLAEGNLTAEGEVTTLNLIIRADVRGSIEAMLKEFGKLEHPEVQIKVLQASVGGVTVADVTLAAASNAVIIGFNVIPDEAARQLADARGVEIRRYDIIYQVTDDLRDLLEGKLKPEQRVADLGRALVQQTFSISRLGVIAGCRVLAGTIERNCRIRVNRDGRGIGEYPLDSLRREKEDVKEVREGYECGMKLAGFNDLKEGDILEAYKIEEVKRTLETAAASG